MVTTRKIIKKHVGSSKLTTARSTKKGNHINNNKNSQDEKNKINQTKALKRASSKSSGKYNVQDKGKIISHTKVISKITESRKRKREDNINNGENLDCINLNDLSEEHILQCIRVINHLTEEQLKNNNALFDDENQPIFVQVTCVRIPKTPKRCMRILLPHSIVSSSDEIALFVGDLQRGRRKDYEPTVEHYEDLLRNCNCTKIKTIIPMNQVKTEYDQYELKRKLVGSYDHFLVDGKIAGHLSHLLGKEFYKKRKLPTSIRMHSKDLKHEIDYALRKTAMQIHSYGDTHIVQIGHTSMERKQVLENVLATCNYLSKNYPGGWANIRSICIKTSSSLSLPIYTTLKNKCLVKVPIVQPKRPKAYRNVSGELTTIENIASVTLTPEGDIYIENEKILP
ncbi:hypothetical protein K0M31_013782 [Melipona bicolor]|uniref:Ribosomal protein L1 n=1 Tax=Melipona bicolor TaxID=60889 RepID=A0AA40KG58_9HYME|nr:hypothetical protein K0M31_013782 [Melipona bicolor]